MTENTAPDYDEIRRIASKNWLNSASVSLAKLDEVKAKVYNIGLGDANSLKPSPKGLKQKSKDENQTRNLAKPPLSGVPMQKNAWGTVSALPETAFNIREECGKQIFRSRPESAKASARNRPFSGRLKRRPQSATNKPVLAPGPNDELLVEEDDFDEEFHTELGVHGARFEPGERPENFSHHNSSTGYFAPTSQGEDIILHQLSSNIETTTDCDDNVNSNGSESSSFIQIPGGGEMNAPQAPRCSPDLEEMLDSEINYGVQYCNGDYDSQMPSNSQRDCTDGKNLPKTQLPIHFTMPNPNDSYNSDLEQDDVEHNPQLMKVNITINNIQNEANQNQRNDMFGLDNNYDNFRSQVEIDNFTEQSDLKQIIDIRSESSNKSFGVLSHELQQEAEKLKRELKSRKDNTNILSNKFSSNRPKSAKMNSVQFDEQSNCTVDITPRIAYNSNKINETGGDSSATSVSVNSCQPRPYSGRRDLRHVKSRTDSGVKANFNRTNSDQNLIGGTNINNASRSRPQSAKVSTLTVDFGDDSESDDLDHHYGNKFQANKHSITAKPSSNKKDVETMISKMCLSEDGKLNSKNNIDLALRNSQAFQSEENDQLDTSFEDRPGSRPGSQARCYSSSEKNYYELAMSVNAASAPPLSKNRKVSSKSQDHEGVLEDVVGTKEIKKTIKTLELMDGRELKEMKFVSVIGAQEYKVNDYVAPKPSRPTSAIRPQSAKKTITKNAIKRDDKVEKKSVHPCFPHTTSVRQASAPTTGEKYQHVRHNINPTAKPPIFKPSSQNNYSQRQYHPVERSNKENSCDTVVQDIELDDYGIDMEVRPGSRMGFRPEDNVVRKEESIGLSVESVKPPIGLKKRTVPSANIHQTSETTVAVNSQTRPIHNSSTYLSPTYKTRPISATLKGNKSSSNSCSHTSHKQNVDMASEKWKKITDMAIAVKREKSSTSVTDIMANATNFSGYANLKVNKLGANTPSHDLPTLDVVEITTRQNEYQFDTDGVKECRELQDRLLDSGVPVTLSALERALLPPTEYGWNGPSYKSNITPNHPEFSSISCGLLSKPETWLVQEYKKIKEAEKKVQIATEMLEEQAREDNGVSKKRKKKKVPTATLR